MLKRMIIRPKKLRIRLLLHIKRPLNKSKRSKTLLNWREKRNRSKMKRRISRER
jgi:hypothetical protein